MKKKRCLCYFLSVIAAVEISKADFGDEIGPLIPTPDSGKQKEKLEPTRPPAQLPSATPSATQNKLNEKAQHSAPADPVLNSSPNPKLADPSPAPTKQAQSSEPPGLLSDDVTQHNQDAPIHIEGDLVKGNRTEGKLVLEGNVKLTQDDAELLSNKATVYSDPGTTKTKRAVAVGNVRFFKKSNLKAPPLRAEAEEMEYFIPERRIRLTGQPKVWRANELIQGKEIFVELDTGSVTIKEARGVVEPSAAHKGPGSMPFNSGSSKNKASEPKATKAPSK